MAQRQLTQAEQALWDSLNSISYDDAMALRSAYNSGVFNADTKAGASAYIRFFRKGKELSILTKSNQPMNSNYEDLLLKIIFAFDGNANGSKTTGEIVTSCYANPLPKDAARVCTVLAIMRKQGYAKRIKRGLYQLTAKGKECLE